MPRAFHTTLATIPAPGSYLSSTPDKVSQWQQKLGAQRMPRVGLAWSGNPAHSNDDHRSIGFAEIFQRLPEGLQYIGLQRDVRPADKAAIESAPGFVDFSSELQDFSDTAALCELVDVVISVDTSVAHLAGALGKVTWVLLPHIGDWRWLRDRTDSPWYPAMTLYRQPAVADWDSVLAALSADLALVEHRVIAANAPSASLNSSAD